jgi:integrase
MTWGEVDFERSQFVVTGGINGTKNHEARPVPLFPAMRSLLERMKSERETPVNYAERIIPTGHARKAMATACKKAGLPHFHHHLFRHFFVSQAIEAGVDFKTIAAWVGHKDGGVLVARTYGHLTDTHSAAMALKMTFSAS